MSLSLYRWNLRTRCSARCGSPHYPQLRANNPDVPDGRIVSASPLGCGSQRRGRRTHPCVNHHVDPTSYPRRLEDHVSSTSFKSLPGVDHATSRDLPRTTGGGVSGAGIPCEYANGAAASYFRKPSLSARKRRPQLPISGVVPSISPRVAR